MLAASCISQTLVIYEGGALPGYDGQMIAGMALTNRMQASRVLKDTSSFRTEDSDAIVLSNSRWFHGFITKKFVKAFHSTHIP